MSGERVLLGIDLRLLEPQRFDPDEDMVQASFLGSGPPWIDEDHPPPMRVVADGIEAAGQDGSLARWADETPGFDAPAVTARSLERGRVAYHGIIPPEAIQEIHHPSEGYEHFTAQVTRHIPTLDLPKGPASESYRIEIARAYGLAASVIDGAMGSVEPGWGGSTHFELPEEATDVAHRLRGVARRLRHADEFDRAQLAAAAAGVAEAVSGFEPEVGWSSNRDQCVLVAEQAAECVRLTALVAGDAAGADSARSAADSVLRAGSVP